MLHGFEMINFSVRARALAGKCPQDSSATGHCPVHGGAPAEMYSAAGYGSVGVARICND